MEEYIPICPSVRLYVCHSFTAYYRQRSADISGQIPFLFGLFLRPALRNPVLPLRFQIDAETPRAVAADHVNVFFIQELRERLGGNAVPFVFVFGIPDAESLKKVLSNVKEETVSLNRLKIWKGRLKNGKKAV